MTKITNYEELKGYIKSLNKIGTEEIENISSKVAFIERKDGTLKDENAFFHTPLKMANKVFKAIEPSLSKDAVILEPTCGFGSLIFPILLNNAPFKRIDGIELSKDLAEIAKLIIDKMGYTDKINIYNDDTLSRYRGDEINIIIANPPFGKNIKETEKKIILKILEQLEIGQIDQLVVILPTGYIKSTLRKQINSYGYEVEVLETTDGFDNTKIKVDLYCFTKDESLRTFQRNKLKTTINVKINKVEPLLYDISLIEEPLSVSSSLKNKGGLKVLNDYIDTIPDEVEKLDIYRQGIFYRLGAMELGVGYKKEFLDFVKNLTDKEIKDFYNICYLDASHTIDYLLLLGDKYQRFKDKIDEIVLSFIVPKTVNKLSLQELNLLNVDELNYVLNTINPFIDKEDIEKAYKYLSIDNGYLKKLKPHQLVGFYKAVTSIKERNGFIISDDVGLGKTYVGASVIIHFLKHNTGKVLLLAPKTVIDGKSWIRTFKDLGLTDEIIKNRIIISTHQSVTKYVGNNDISFIVVDEAHYFRNRKSENAGDKGVFYKALASFNRDGKVPMLMLTATPINNKIMDLVNIINLYYPKIMDSVRAVTITGVESGVLNGILAQHISKYTRDDIIRIYGKDDPRYKGIDSTIKPEIIYLSTKEYEKEYPEYKEIIERILNKLIEKKQRKKDEDTDEKDRKDIVAKGLVFINKLKQLDSLPYLFAKTKEEGKELLDFLETKLGKYKDFKIRLLVDIIKKNKGNKILIFSFYKEVGKVIKDVLQQDFPNLRIETVNGEDNSKQRNKIIKLFAPKANNYQLKDGEKEIDVLIATGTFDEGVNLQDAHILVNFDLPFNPVVTWQRIGRIYRMGIKHIPKIYNFIPSAVIEKGLGLMKKLGMKENKIQGFFNQDIYDATDGGNKNLDFDFLKGKMDNTEELLFNGGKGQGIENLLKEIITKINTGKSKKLPLGGGHIYVFITSIGNLLKEPIIVPINSLKMLYNINCDGRLVFNVDYYKELADRLNILEHLDIWEEVNKKTIELVKKNGIDFIYPSYLDMYKKNDTIGTIHKIITKEDYNLALKKKIDLLLII